MNEVVVIGGVRDELLAGLRAKYRLHELDRAPDRNAALAAAAAVQVGVIGAANLDAATVDALPGLKLVALFGVGYDRIDVAALRKRAIALTNTAGGTDVCVADHAIGLMLAVFRRIAAGDRHVRAGKWLERRYPLQRRASFRRMGILGLGGIGAQVARRALGFDMPVGYHNRRPRGDSPYAYFASLRALAEWADVLVVACPGGAATRHLVNAEVLAALGSDGILVNIARGSIIDEAALAAALADGTIAGAGLDVFEVEPCFPQALVGLENVVLTPHMGGGTIETWNDCDGLVQENVRRFFAGEALLTPVT